MNETSSSVGAVLSVFAMSLYSLSLFRVAQQIICFGKLVNSSELLANTREPTRRTKEKKNCVKFIDFSQNNHIYMFRLFMR